MSGPFHVVRHAVNDVTTTYCIYANNEPFLVPTKATKLGRREAHWIAETLNRKLEGIIAEIPRKELLAGKKGLRKCA
jgi:hypothetical protein